MRSSTIALLLSAGIACVISPTALAPAQTPATQPSPKTTPSTHPSFHTMRRGMDGGMGGGWGMGMRPHPFDDRGGRPGPRPFGDDFMPPPHPGEFGRRGDDDRQADRDGHFGDGKQSQAKHRDDDDDSDLADDVSALTKQVKKLRQQIAELQDTVDALQESQQETRRHHRGDRD